MTPDGMLYRLQAACYADCRPGDVLRVSPSAAHPVTRLRDGAALPVESGRLAAGLASGQIVPVQAGGRGTHLRLI